MATTTPRSRFGNVIPSSGGTTSSTVSSGRYGSNSATSNPTTATTAANSGSSNGTNGAAVGPHRFQSRFLGRAGTPTGWLIFLKYI